MLTLRESPEFTKQLDQLRGILRLDDPLDAIYWAISSSPKQYETVIGTRGIRLAKTEEMGTGNDYVPVLRVWFRISKDDTTVDLLFLE